VALLWAVMSPVWAATFDLNHRQRRDKARTMLVQWRR
jgi:hypothetical protein